ncbi:MAG: alpha/beta hydrolase [Dokdonella sp.]
MKKSIQYAVAGVIVVGAIGHHFLRDKPEVPVIPEANRVAIAANAKDFTIGTLAFTSCDLKQPRSSATTAAFCAPFAVPEDRSKPDGRKIDMRLALIESDNAVADGFVFFIAGGPGQSAVDNWPQIAPAFAPLRKNRNILLLDQRGIGGSNALECASLPDETAADFDPAIIEQRTRECLDKVSQHSDPSQYTTTAAVEDIEALRIALGGPTLDLVGVSYGTRVAQQYLMRHPDGVRSVVLDSVAPNSLVLGQEFSRNLDDALKAQFTNCTKTPQCKKAFGDPMANLLTLRDRYKAEPKKVTVHDPVDFAESSMTLNENVLASVARMHAYSPETAALLPLIISEALKGDTAPLLGQAKMLERALEELSNSAMQLSVICSEDVDRMKVDPAQANSLLGNTMVDVMQQQCAIWPKGTRPADFNASLVSDKPVLILEGELDPVTPPRYGEEVMKGLTNGKLIVAKGQGHNVIGRGCIPKLVGKFVSELAPAKLDTKCVDQLGPIPAFISFSGATP